MNKQKVTISHEVISIANGVLTVAVMCDGRLAGIVTGKQNGEQT